MTSSVQTKPIISHSSDETEIIGARLGAKLRGGETIELISDLGGGKTTFVRGLARGLGSKDVVASPTFTINRLYQSGNITLFHFDFYRLSEPGVIANELAEVVHDSNSVIVVEWGDIVKDILPLDRLSVTFENTGETERKLTFAYPEALTYLISKDA